MFGLAFKAEVDYWRSVYEQEYNEHSITSNNALMWRKELVTANRALLKHSATIKKLKARIKELESKAAV